MAGPNYQNAFAELVKGINLDDVKRVLGNEAKDLFEKIADEFAKNVEGAYANDDVKLRTYRIAFEREIGMRKDFVKKSNELFEADLKLQKTKFKAGKGRVPYYRPGHISSADDLIARTKRAEAWLADKRRSKFAREGAQRAARDRRLQELSPDDSAAIHRYKEQYGAGWRDVALKEYRDLMMSIRSPEQYSRLQAIRQWGTDFPVLEAQDIEYNRRLKATTAHTSAEKRDVRIDAYASSMGRKNAEKLVDAEDDERRRASRAERRKEQLSGYFAYKRDMFMSGLDEREQFAYAHAKQYGGGAKGRDRARDVWNRQFLTEFKWLKPLAKNSTFINKHLPSIAKGLGVAGKLPFGIGRLATNPYALVSAAAMGFFKANAASISQQRNIQPLLANTAVAGKAPLDFVEAGTKRGLTQEQIQQEYANIIGTFGSIEAVRQFAGVSPGIAKMAMAKSLGLSHSAFAIIDEMRGISTKFSGGASTDSLISDLNKYGMLPGTSISTKILSMLPEFMQKGIFAGYAATAGSEARAIGLGDPALRLAGLSDEEIIRRYGPEVSGLGFWHGTEVGIAGVPFAGEFARGFEDLTDSVLDFFGADATKETKAHRRRLANKIRKLWIEQHGNNHSSMLRGKTNLSDVYREATGAAESADSFEASLRESGTTVASITKGGDTISIDTVVLRDVRNLDDFMDEVKRVAGGESIVASSDTLRMIDPGMI